MPRFRGAPVDLVVDVRSHVEFWLGALPGAVCIPVTSLPEGLARHQGVSGTSRILVYCASGNRSAMAAAQLRNAGYSNVVDGGGMAAAGQQFTPGG
ncbi:MAG TPA: rhodanese-like domain-containing protein [Gemmatimonadaceae bacterium]